MTTAFDPAPSIQDQKATKRPDLRALSYLGIAAVGIAAAQLADRVDWHSGSGTHTDIELLACVIAALVGTLAMTRYYSAKSNVYLLIGTGFLGTAALDAYHAVVTSAARKTWWSLTRSTSRATSSKRTWAAAS